MQSQSAQNSLLDKLIFIGAVFLAAFIVIFAPLGIESLLAESPNTFVVVRVREIQANGMPKENVAASALSLEGDLTDLHEELMQLQYVNYKLLKTEERKVKIKNQELISFRGGHSLKVRPLYIKKNGETARVGMWLHWQDRKGSEILDTRMHFRCGEPMITGTERSPDTGLILAIDVKPVG